MALYAGIRRAVMVEGLSRRGQLHSTLGYVSPMTFEARHEVERKGSSEEERNAASSPGLGRRQTGASSRLRMSRSTLPVRSKNICLGPRGNRIKGAVSQRLAEL